MFPITFRQRINWLIPSPISFSLKRVPLKGHLSQLPIFHLQLLSDLRELLLVVGDLIHVLGLLELVLVEGSGKLVELSVALG